MKKLRTPLLIVVMMATFSTFTSCYKQEVETPYSEESDGKPILVRARDKESTLILSRRKYQDRPITRSTILGFNEYLGRSFKTSYYPIETANNLGTKVINVEFLSKNNPSWFSIVRIGNGIATSYAYSSFERYTSNSTTTKTVNGGFDINLGLFSLGSKTTVTNIFSETTANDINSIFGQVDVEIRDRLYNLTLNTNRIRNLILNDYLDKYFIDDLYNLTPREFFASYGGFVLSNFYTGGRATALYAGKYTGNETTQNREKHMNTDINASYGFKTGNAGGDFGFGKNFVSGSTTSKKVTNLETSIEVRGGAYNVLGFTPAQSVETLNVNLSPWVSSLTDINTHVMVGINDGGLIPITEFVMEENLKKQLNHFYDPDFSFGNRTDEANLIEPEIHIYYFIGTNFRVFLAAVLKTRFNDRVVLSEDANHISLANFTQRREELINKLSDVFKINIYADPAPTINNNNSSSGGYYQHPNRINAYKIDRTKMSKYSNPNTGIMYVLGTSTTGEKIGFSIYEDFLLDTYGIRAWYNSLPTINITPQNLFNYKIIAL